MAELAGELWRYNLARVVVVDVSDDYALMQPALPKHCYPVLREVLLPRYRIRRRMTTAAGTNQYLYDWHESPAQEGGDWFVGVVNADLLA